MSPEEFVKSIKMPAATPEEFVKSAMPKVDLPDIEKANKSRHGVILQSPTKPAATDEPTTENPGMSSLDDLSEREQETAMETSGWLAEDLEKVTKDANRYEWTTVRQTMIDNWDWSKQGKALATELWAIPSMVLPGRRGPDQHWVPNAGITDIGHLLVELETALQVNLGGGKLQENIIPTPLDAVRWLARANAKTHYGINYEDSETPMLDAAIEFYRERYPFGNPDFDKAFGMVLAHDLPGVLADFSMVISLLGGAARGGAKGASAAQRGLKARMDTRLAKDAGWQPSKMAMAWEKQFGGFQQGMERIADFANTAMKKPSLSSMPGMPMMANRLIDKWGRFQERWGAADVLDPATMPIMAGIELLRGKQNRALTKQRQATMATRKAIGASNMEMRSQDLPQMTDAAIAESYEARGGQRGNPVRLIGSDPTNPLNQLDAEWAVFEMDELTYSSHALSGQPNEIYPQQYQQRDRSTDESMQGVRHKAGTLAPELLIQQTASVTEGSPIVIAKRDPQTGEVQFYALGGNGRLMAVDSAHMQGLKGAQAYTDYLKAHATEFGIDPTQIEGMTKPVLVRVIRNELDEAQTIQATRIFNEPAPEAQRAGEIAGEDVKTITPGLLLKFNLTGDTSLERMLQAPSNRDMLTQFIGSLPRGERAALMTNGAPNNQAIDRFINAFASRAYEGADPRLRRFLLESGEELKNVQNTALMIAPKIVEIKSQIENGLIPPEYDIGRDIGEAMAFYVDVYNYQPGGRASRIADYLGQPDLFGTINVSGSARLFADFFEQNRTSPRIMREVLGKYFDEVLAERDLFDTPLRPKKEILAEVLEGRVEGLDELLQGVPNLDEVPQNVERAVESIETTNDALEADGNLVSAGESNASTLDEFTTENNQQWKASLDEQLNEMISTGEIAPDMMVAMQNFLNVLSPEMRHEFSTRMTNLGARQEFLDKIKAVADPQLETAMRNYQSALEADPTNRHAHVGMYWANHELNNKAEAERWADDAVKIAPDDPYAHSAQGSARMEKSDYNGAVESFSRALAFQSNDSFALKGRALAYTYLDRLDDANTDMDRAIDLDRVNSEFRGSPDVETGRTRFEDKIKSEPSETGATKAAGRGWGRFEKGEYNDAIARADYALDKEPGHTEAYNVRGWSHYRLGKYDDSLNDFDNMLQNTSPDNRRDLEFGYNGRGYNNYRLAQKLIRAGRKQEGLQKLLAAQDDLSRAEALKRGVELTEGIELTSEVTELPHVRSTDETAIPPEVEVDPTVLPDETPLDTPPQEGGETVEPPPPDATPADMTEDVTTALRLLDESEQNIRIEMMDNQKVGIYEGLDDDGNPTEKRLAFDADTDDNTVTQAVRQAIEAERASLREGSGTSSETTGEEAPPVTPDDEMPDIPEGDIPNSKTVNIAGTEHNFRRVESSEVPDGIALHIIYDPPANQQRANSGTSAETYQRILTEGKLKATKPGITEFPEQARDPSDLTRDEGYVFFSPTHKGTHTQYGKYGFLFDLERMQQDGIIGVRQDDLATSVQTGDEARQMLNDAQSETRKNMEVLVSNEIDINKYIIGVVENGEFFVKGEDGTQRTPDADAPTPEISELEARIEDRRRRAEEAQQALTQAENSTELGASREQRQTLEIIRNNAERFQRELRNAEEELANAQSGGGDGGDGPTRQTIDEAVPEVALEDVLKFRDFIDRYIKEERARPGDTMNRYIEDYIVVFDTLLEDLTLEVVGKKPEWEDIAGLFQDARSMVANKMQADFVDFIKQELGHIVGDIDRFSRIRDQLFDELQTPEDVSRILSELEPNDQMRAQAGFLQRFIDDWAEGDMEALRHLAGMEEDGRLNAFLGPEIMEAMSTIDDIVRDFNEGDASPRVRMQDRRKLEDAQREQAMRESEAAEAQRELEESETREAEAESEQLDAEQDEMQAESQESDVIQRTAVSIREQRKSYLEAKAHQAESEAEAASIRSEFERQAIERQIKNEQETGQQNNESLAQREMDAIEQAEKSLAERESIIEGMLGNQNEGRESAHRTEQMTYYEAERQKVEEARIRLEDRKMQLAHHLEKQQQIEQEVALSREQRETEQRETEQGQTKDTIDFARSDPQLQKASAKREAEGNRSALVKTLARIGNSGGLGWTVGTFGLHLAVRSAAKTLVWVADGWQVRQILKRYESHFDGPDGEKWVVEAFFAMLKEAKRKGTSKTMSMVNNPAKRPSLAVTRMVRGGSRGIAMDEEERESKRRPERNQRRGLLYNPAQ